MRSHPFSAIKISRLKSEDFRVHASLLSMGNMLLFLLPTSQARTGQLYTFDHPCASVCGPTTWIYNKLSLDQINNNVSNLHPWDHMKHLKFLQEYFNITFWELKRICCYFFSSWCLHIIYVVTWMVLKTVILISQVGSC